MGILTETIMWYRELNTNLQDVGFDQSLSSILGGAY